MKNLIGSMLNCQSRYSITRLIVVTFFSQSATQSHPQTHSALSKSAEHMLHVKHSKCIIKIKKINNFAECTTAEHRDSRTLCNHTDKRHMHHSCNKADEIVCMLTTFWETKATTAEHALMTLV